MDQARFFSSRDDSGADAGLLGNGLEELAAVFRLAHRAGRAGNDVVDLVRVRQPGEFRENLQRQVHGFRRQRPAVEAAGPQPDHLLFPVDDLEGQVRLDLHDDHVQGIGPDVDGCQSH